MQARQIVLRSTLGVVLGLAGLVRAQDPQPAGPEFQVNTFTPGDQGRYLRRAHDVCTQPDGRFVVVWHARDFHDGDGAGIFGQRYDAAGARDGTEFQVNSYTTGYQEEPDLACLDDGGFVVAWHGRSDSGYRISAKRFDSAGVAQTDDLAVSGFADYLPSVAPQPGAGFVVVWAVETPAYEVRARRFASSGAPAGTELLVNGDTGNRARNPQVDTDPAGNFVVVWQNDDGDGEGAAVRRFDASGAPLGTEFQASVVTDGAQEKPSVSVAGDGTFVVVWHSNNGDFGVSAQRFASDGTRLGTHFQVNADATYRQYYGAFVDHDAAGDFVVTWTNLEQSEEGGYGVFGRRFDAVGAPLGTEFQANTYTTSYQMYGRVSVTPSGDFVVAWASRYQDGDDLGIFARRWIGPSCEALIAKRTKLGFKGPGADSVSARADFATAAAFDPSTTDTIEIVVADGTGVPIFSAEIAPGPLWAKSKPEKRRFTWKAPKGASGLAAIKITERPLGSGQYRMTFRGRDTTLLQAAPTAGTHQLRVRFSSGPCVEGGTASCSRRPKSETCSAD